MNISLKRLVPRFLADANSYPHFLNRKAENRFGKILGALMGLLCLAIPSILVLMAALGGVKHPPQWLVETALMVLFITVITVIIALYVIGMGLRLFARNRVLAVDLLALIDGIGKKKQEGWVDEVEQAKESALEVSRRILAILQERTLEQMRIVSGYRDLKVERIKFKDMSFLQLLGTVFIWIAGIAMVAYGVALVLGLFAPAASPPGLVLDPTVELFRSGRLDVPAGIAAILIGIGGCLGEYSIMRVRFSSRSDDSLKDFMKEMGI